MSLDITDPVVPSNYEIKPQVQAKPALVNEQKLPEDLQRILKSSLHKGGSIDDYKEAHFEAVRGDKIAFHIKPKQKQEGTYIVRVTGNEGSTRDKGKHNRGASFRAIEVANYTVNWQEDAELLTILEKKMGQSDDNKAKLHGMKKK